MTASNPSNDNQTSQTHTPAYNDVPNDTTKARVDSKDDNATSQEILVNIGRTPLPFPPPLQREMFATPDFNSDAFLSNRRHITLDELKRELTTHLKSLKSELVEMINRDYASFVDLSTNLKGVDKVIEEVARPLGKMREEVQVPTNLVIKEV